MLLGYALVVGSLAVAAPTILAENTAAAEALVAKPLELSYDDVIIYGLNNTFEIVKEHQYLEMIESGSIKIRDNEDLEVEEETLIQARQNCNQRNVEFEVTSTQDFSDWDKQLSPVVGALQAPASISISRGYSISNSISISASAGITDGVFSAQFGIEYSRTWTSIDTTIIQYTIPTGFYGVVVHNPWAHRKIGTAYTSCGTGSTTSSPYQATSYTSQSLGNMNWVQGAYRLCTSRSSSIPFCQGRGTHR